MGTKLQQLRNGCFHRAMDDEPMFVLLARDDSAPELVRSWANTREADVTLGKRPSSDLEKVYEARKLANEMEEWRDQNNGHWRNGLFAKTA